MDPKAWLRPAWATVGALVVALVGCGDGDASTSTLDGGSDRSVPPAPDGGNGDGGGGDGQVQPVFHPAITSFPKLAAAQDGAWRYRTVIQGTTDTPKFSIKTGPTTATVDANGSVQWKPSATAAGASHKFVVESVVGGTTLEQTFEVHVPKVTTAVQKVIDPATAKGSSQVGVQAPLSPIQGASVTVPEGALDQPKMITIGAVEAAPPLAAAEVGGGSVDDALVVGFGPSGTTFKKPAVVVVPLSDAVMQKAAGDPASVSVWTLDGVAGKWQRLAVERVDLATRTASVRAKHFSEFVAIASPSVVSAPAVTAGSAACASSVFAPASLALSPDQVQSRWLNGYDAAVHPSTLQAALGALGADQAIRLVYEGVLRLDDASVTATRYLVVDARSDGAGGVDVAVTDGAGAPLLSASGLAPASAELARLLSGAANQLVFQPVYDAASHPGTVTVRAYGYFIAADAPSGRPTSLGASFGEAAASYGVLSAGTDDADCDGVLDADDPTPTGLAPPRLEPVTSLSPRVLVGDPLVLEVAPRSDDSTGATVTWSAQDGVLVPSDTQATYTPDTQGTHRVTAVVTDAGGQARVTFEVLAEVPATNTPPDCAIAASASKVFVGDTVVLTAAGSDPEQEADALTYQWTADLPGVLSATNGAEVTLTSMDPSDVQVRCTADDGIDTGVAATATISFVDRPPNAPPELTLVQPLDTKVEVPAGSQATVNLFARATDPDGDALTFDFTPTVGAPTLTPLSSDGTSVTETFQTDVPGSYTIVVRARDSLGSLSDPLRVTVLVTQPLGTTDLDSDGYPNDIDCDDLDPSIHPGAEEICFDGVDQDCQGGDPPAADCDTDQDGFTTTTGDCDDMDETQYPGAFERCNLADDDCDGMVDDGYPLLGTTCTAGVGACRNTGVYECSESGLGTVCTAVPGVPSTETCNGVDDDCNGVIDDGMTCPVCGNGVVEGPESCDPCPSTCDDGDACTVDAMTGSPATCDVDCQYQPVMVCQSGDGCCPIAVACTSLDDSDCPPYCGNGVLEAGEECDDGNGMYFDGCTPMCTIEVCGNGVIDPGEECDDGNFLNGDGCSDLCTSEATCGDGIVGIAEACDDGNTTGGDGCAADCRSIEIGYYCPTPGALCVMSTCGDGILVPGEACDDGNQTSGDGCTATCQQIESGYYCPTPGQPCLTSTCGDGILAAGEQCDDGVNDGAYGGCNPNCTLAPYCGDGALNGPEQCDDGVNDGTACAPDCTLP